MNEIAYERAHARTRRTPANLCAPVWDQPIVRAHFAGLLVAVTMAAWIASHPSPFSSIFPIEIGRSIPTVAPISSIFPIENDSIIPINSSIFPIEIGTPIASIEIAEIVEKIRALLNA